MIKKTACMDYVLPNNIPKKGISHESLTIFS
jgi:hypothetical protein